MVHHTVNVRKVVSYSGRKPGSNRMMKFRDSMKRMSRKTKPQVRCLLRTPSGLYLPIYRINQGHNPSFAFGFDVLYQGHPIFQNFLDTRVDLFTFICFSS